MVLSRNVHTGQYDRIIDNNGVVHRLSSHNRSLKMTSYIVKPNYNGTDKKTFTDPVEAVAYYQKYVESVSGKMIGTLEDKMEEMVWIEKLQIIQDNA